MAGFGKPAVAIAALIGLGVAGPALAHFQMIYTPESALERGVETQMALVFTHPFNGGPTMAMGVPRNFYVVAKRGDEGDLRKTDLKDRLKPIQWTNGEGKFPAYEVTLPRDLIRSLGDYVFVMEPEPYLEKEEDVYIQQIAKLVMNVGGVPGNWADPVGLPTEIQPLNKPYANWTGGVFRGVVLSGGKPVPFAEIEVEYVNHAPDLAARAFAMKGAVTPPHAAYENVSLRADASGSFAIGLPKAGWWGIAALDIGQEKTFNGKPLSQDAVLWVQAKDMTP